MLLAAPILIILCACASALLLYGEVQGVRLNVATCFSLSTACRMRVYSGIGVFFGPVDFGIRVFAGGSACKLFVVCSSTIGVWTLSHSLSPDYNHMSMIKLL